MGINDPHIMALKDALRAIATNTEHTENRVSDTP